MVLDMNLDRDGNKGYMNGCIYSVYMLCVLKTFDGFGHPNPNNRIKVSENLANIKRDPCHDVI